MELGASSTNECPLNSVEEDSSKRCRVWDVAVSTVVLVRRFVVWCLLHLSSIFQRRGDVTSRACSSPALYSEFLSNEEGTMLTIAISSHII